MKFAFESLLPQFCDVIAITVKTVQVTSERLVTPLKRGANEKMFFLLVGLFVGVWTGKGASVFDDFVRVTEALTPQQQLTNFHLPPGFEMQLVASEPEIGKPMNMAFDAQGRLWLTQSREYPFPVLPVEKQGRDKIMVLEDFDANGHARKITP